MKAPPELDAALIERARAGDGAAFAAIVRRYDRGLRALAFRLLGDRDRMDDVLQDAYVKAFRGLAAFRGAASAGTWLYRIVYNACLDELRAQQPPTLGLDELSDLAAGAPEIGAALSERDRIARALAALPVAQRAAVLLVDGQGLDYESAAAALGVPEGTVASRLSIARAALRRDLADERRADV